MTQNKLNINRKLAIAIVVCFHLLLLAHFAKGQELGDTLVIEATRSGMGISMFPLTDGVYELYLTGCVKDYSLLGELEAALQEEGITCSSWNMRDNIVYVYRNENQSELGLVDDVWNTIVNRGLLRRLIASKD